MKKVVMAVVIIGLSLSAALAQKKVKPWSEWSEKEVLKMLNDSAWGQTQTETNTAEMFFSPTAQGGGRVQSRPLDPPSGSGSSDRSGQGATNQAVNMNFHIRFLTAKPIREALARRAQMQNPQLADRLAAFAEQKTDQFIVVAVDYDSPDQRFTGKIFQMFGGTNTGALQNKTYLERKDGKRVFLTEYIKPANDGMGAKFVFPRLLDGQPFIIQDSGYIRFFSEINKDAILNMRFNVKNMLYDGVLEF